MNNITYQKISVIFVFFSLSFYIKLFNISNISVLLIIFSIFILTIFGFNQFIKNKVPNDFRIVLFFYVIYLSYALIQNYYFSVDITSALFWWVILLVCYFILSDVKRDNVILAYKIYLFFSCLVLTYDTYYRMILNPDARDIGRYAFKFGLIDMDSNFSGFFAVMCFSLILLLSRKLKKKFIFSKLIFFILSLLSFSISSVVTVCAIYLYDKTINIKLNDKYKLFVYAIIFSFIVVSIPLLIGMVNSDGSGSSKIYLLVHGFNAFYYNDIYTSLFGVGMNQGNIDGMGPQVLIIKCLVELGLVGTILFFCMLFSNKIIIGKNIFYFIVPYFISGLSVVSLSSPVICASLLLLYMSKNLTNEK